MTFGYLSPVRWAIVALEGAIWRDFGVAEMAVPCAVLLAVAAVTFVIGASRQQSGLRSGAVGQLDGSVQSDR